MHRYFLALVGVLAFLVPVPPVQDSAVEQTALLVSLIGRPVGRETFTAQRNGDHTTYAGALDLTERGGRLQVASSLRLAEDLTPVEFSVKGKSYRFVNVDSSVKVTGGVATVTNLGETRTFEAPRRFFTAQSYSPLSARALLIRYWQRHGRPETLAVLPGEPTRDVRIRLRGRDTVTGDGRSQSLERYDVDGIVWGRESVWLDSDGRLAAIVSRIHILPLEAVREDLRPALPALQASSNADRANDLAKALADAQIAGDTSFALVGARLVDGTGRDAIADSIVVVRDGRITAAGPRATTRAPQGLRIHDLHGATLIPGVWEMHAHAAQMEWFPAYLAAGVTTVRDMGGEAAYLTTIRDRIAAAELGPRLLLAGLVDGVDDGAFGSVAAGTPQQGRDVVDAYHRAGFNQMKLYSLLQPDVVSAITARAHELGMTVTGHVPTSLGLLKAVEAGMDHVAHLPITGDTQAPQTRATIDVLAKRKTVIDPTLPWNELLGRAPETALDSFEPGFAHAPPALLSNYRSIKNDTDAATARRRVVDSERMVKALFDAGVPIVAGTDGALPGYSVLRSIEMYVEAGMTPMQAIASATRVPAESMGAAKESGTIEVGKRADLLVLDADPLADIKNIRKLRWVVANGRLMDPAKLWAAAGFK
jgi:imidazolonepropionase-like amidohydrolase